MSIPPEFERLAEFFADDEDKPYRAPTYNLQESPVASLINSAAWYGDEKIYWCRLHPDFKNIHWQTIEHHIKFSPGCDHYDTLKSNSSS